MTSVLDTLKTLSALSGVSGAEDSVRDFIKSRVAPFADDQNRRYGQSHRFQKGAQNAFKIADAVRPYG